MTFVVCKIYIISFFVIVTYVHGVKDNLSLKFFLRNFSTHCKKRVVHYSPSKGVFAFFIHM